MYSTAGSIARTPVIDRGEGVDTEVGFSSQGGMDAATILFAGPGGEEEGKPRKTIEWAGEVLPLLTPPQLGYFGQNTQDRW